MKRLRRITYSDAFLKAVAGLIVAVILAAIIGLTLWIRHSAPCWVFPLAEAPSRCLVVNPR